MVPQDIGNLSQTASSMDYIVRTYPALVLIAIVCVFACFALLYRDFNAFLALGPGGTPSTFLGYVKIKFLSLFAISDPYTPPEIPPTIEPQSGYLKHLIPRFGPRPTTKGIAPHRQQDQQPTPVAFKALASSIHELAEKYPAWLRLGTSCLEKHGPGLFATTQPADIKSRTGARNCPSEICHTHPSDGSTHLTLHPADAAILLRAGWGERHPLSKGGWLNRFVPGGFVLVYAPRTEMEVEVVMQIIEAAIWWVGGLDVNADDSGMEKGRDGAGMKRHKVLDGAATCHHCGR